MSKEIIGKFTEEYRPRHLTWAERYDLLQGLQQRVSEEISLIEEYQTKCYRYNTPTKDIMIREVITVDPSFTIEEAAKEMVDHDINMLPVVQDGQVVGILTRGDIIKALAAECM